MPNASAIRYRKNMYAPYLFSKICIQILLYPQSNSHTPFRKPCCIYIQHTPPAMFFHFLSPGVGRNMQDRPAWLPEYPAAPFHATAIPGRRSGCRVLRQRYHYHPDFKAACQRCPMPGMPLMPFLLLLRFLVPSALWRRHPPWPQTGISPRSSPLITLSGAPNVLCPYILIFRSGR